MFSSRLEDFIPIKKYYGTVWSESQNDDVLVVATYEVYHYWSLSLRMFDTMVRNVYAEEYYWKLAGGLRNALCEGVAALTQAMNHATSQVPPLSSL